MCRLLNAFTTVIYGKRGLCLVAFGCSSFYSSGIRIQYCYHSMQEFCSQVTDSACFYLIAYKYEST